MLGLRLALPHTDPRHPKNSRPIDPSALVTLAKECPLITEVHCDGCNIGDEGVEAFCTSCSRLEIMHATSTNVSDDGAWALARLPRLKELSVEIGTRVRPSTLRKINRRYPKLAMM